MCSSPDNYQMTAVPRGNNASLIIWVTATSTRVEGGWGVAMELLNTNTVAVSAENEWEETVIKT